MYAIWSKRLSFPFDRMRIFLWSDREAPKVLRLLWAHSRRRGRDIYPPGFRRHPAVAPAPASADTTQI